MCSATWLQDDRGYQLFFNRDEQFTRQPAAPPRLQTRHGVKFIAPVDGAHGGTWIAANEFGLSLCLLNRADKFAPAQTTSRGQIILELIAGTSLAQVREKIAALNFACFRPFTLAALAPTKTATVWHWTGRELSCDPHGATSLPLTSSSYETAAVTAGRSQQFRAHCQTAPQLDAKFLRSFHRSHQPERGAYSVCMHRADARTVSFSWLNATPRRIDFLYYPDSPCLAPQPYASYLRRHA